MKGRVAHVATLNASASEEKGYEIEKSLKTIQVQARKDAAEIVRENAATLHKDHVLQICLHRWSEVSRLLGKPACHDGFGETKEKKA